MRRLLMMLVLLCVLPAGATSLSEFQFEDKAREREFRELTGELRCLVCQNESLAGSNAELAQDLRREIYQMMQDGQTRDQIIEFMVARYGDFVLYSPPIKPSTYLLWFSPLAILLVAVIMLARALRRKSADVGPGISDEERAQAERILAQAEGKQDKNA